MIFISKKVLKKYIYFFLHNKHTTKIKRGRQKKNFAQKKKKNDNNIDQRYKFDTKKIVIF